MYGVVTHLDDLQDYDYSANLVPSIVHSGNLGGNLGGAPTGGPPHHQLEL